MEASDRNSERNHEYHDYPAFYIEERERTVAGFFLLFTPAGMLVVESFKNQYEELQETDRGFPYLKHPVV